MDYEDTGAGEYRETVNIMDLSLGRAPSPAGTNGEVRDHRDYRIIVVLTGMIYRSILCQYQISCHLRQKSSIQRPTLRPHTPLQPRRFAGAMTRMKPLYYNRMLGWFNGKMDR